MNEQPSPSTLEQKFDAVSACARDLQKILGFQGMFRQRVIPFAEQESDPSVVQNDRERDEFPTGDYFPEVCISNEQLEAMVRDLETGCSADLPRTVAEAYQLLTSRAVRALLVSHNIREGHASIQEMKAVLAGAFATSFMTTLYYINETTRDLVIAVAVGILTACALIKRLWRERSYTKLYKRIGAMAALFKEPEGT